MPAVIILQPQSTADGISAAARTACKTCESSRRGVPPGVIHPERAPALMRASGDSRPQPSFALGRPGHQGHFSPCAVADCLWRTFLVPRSHSQISASTPCPSILPRVSAKAGGENDPVSLSPQGLRTACRHAAPVRVKTTSCRACFFNLPTSPFRDVFRQRMLRTARPHLLLPAMFEMTTCVTVPYRKVLSMAMFRLCCSRDVLHAGRGGRHNERRKISRI